MRVASCSWSRVLEVGDVLERVVEQLSRLYLRYVAERLDAVLSEAARTEPTYLEFLDTVLRGFRCEC